MAGRIRTPSGTPPGRQAGVCHAHGTQGRAGPLERLAAIRRASGWSRIPALLADVDHLAADMHAEAAALIDCLPRG